VHTQAKDGLHDDDEPQRPAAATDAGMTQPPSRAVGRVSAANAQQAAPGVPPVPDWEPAGGFAAVAADPSEAALTEVAQRVFGFAGLRGLQLPVIQRVLAGQSTLAIMPTGTSTVLLLRLLDSEATYHGNHHERRSARAARVGNHFAVTYAKPPS